MTAKIILNPYANRWNALKRREEAEAALNQAGVDFDLAVTETPRQGTELAIQAVREGFDPIISAGGDGSISEVVNGLAKAAGDGPLKTFGVLPLGSANDLVVNLGLPKTLLEAAQVIAAGHVRHMDLCQVNQQYFDNNAAVGLEPFITLIQERMTTLRGALRYLVAALRGIWANPRWNMHLEWDDGEYDGPVTLVSVGNSPLTGGLFYMTPHADPFDGQLTFIHGYLESRFAIAMLLPKTMRPGPGSFVEHPAIHEINTQRLRIKSTQPTPAHADGEIFSKAIYDLEYSVLPGRLPILLPEQKSKT